MPGPHCWRRLLPGRNVPPTLFRCERVPRKNRVGAGIGWPPEKPTAPYGFPAPLDEGCVREVPHLNESQLYWAKPDEWSPDQQGYVHLARATLRIGKAVFGDEWDNREPTRVQIFKSDPYAKDRERLIAVQREIARLCQGGVLATAVWTPPLGNMVSIPATFWALKPAQIARRFFRCRMNPQDPFGGGVGGGHFREVSSGHFREIFVSAENLERFLANRTRRTTTDTTPRQKPPGNKPQFDWATFEKEAIRRLMDHGGVGATVAFNPDEPGWHQAILEAEMADWCQKKWGDKGRKVPSVSRIRVYVRNAMAAYLKGDG